MWFDEKLSFSEHIHTKINKAYMMLGIIKRNFKHLIVPTLYCCILVWLDHISIIALLCGHHIKRDIEALEKVQKSYENSTGIETAAIR